MRTRAYFISINRKSPGADVNYFCSVLFFLFCYAVSRFNPSLLASVYQECRQWKGQRVTNCELTEKTRGQVTVFLLTCHCVQRFVKI